MLKATSLPVNALPFVHLTPDRTTILYCLPDQPADFASQLMYLPLIGSKRSSVSLTSPTIPVA